ncbi:MAG TPA: hypothetical protein PLV92_20670 [Pirellulaceae bacterium]|nr:hypothetical protein [Pirellulaceae bacterium]
MQFSQRRSRFANLAVAALCLWFGVQPPPSAADDAGPAGADKALRTVGHPPLESPHVNPIAVVAGRVYVANTPADTVDVIDSATRQVVKRISVGIEPVSLAVRPGGRELWVANHVSDSVSIIDHVGLEEARKKMASLLRNP